MGKVLWITCHSPRHCTASPICKYYNFQKENRIFIATHQKSRRIFHILLLYQTTAKKRKTIAEREKKYNQIKIRRPSETLCENFKHYEYEKKKVKNNYSRVRKRRPRKFCYYHTKKLHLSTLKYKNTNSMDKKREKIIILTFDNITNLPKITLIPLPNTPSLFYGMPKTNFLSFFSLFVCASVH